MSESMMVRGPDRIAENTAVPSVTPISRGLTTSPNMGAIIALVVGFVVFAGAVLVLMYKPDYGR
jgi:hypothetical protein